MSSEYIELPPIGGGSGEDTALRGKYVKSTRYFSIGSGTSGSVTLPPSSTVVLDDFGGTVDAIITTNSGSFPTSTSAKTSSDVVIGCTFDSSGNYVLSGTPSSYPVCIVYRVKQTLIDFDDSATDLWGPTQTDLSGKQDGSDKLTSISGLSYTGNALKVVRVNAGETAFEIGSSVGGTWGSITGTLSAQTDLQSALDLKAPIASPTFTGTVILAADPTSALEASTKQYTDSQIANASNWREICVAATTTALPSCTYSNGTAGVGATLTYTSNGTLVSQDGVVLVLNDRLLVKDQASAFQNGIYYLSQEGDISNPWILTRVTDANTSSLLYPAQVSILNGTTYKGAAFKQTTASPTIGSSSLVWINFLNTTYNAGTDLTLTGSTFSVTANTFVRKSGDTMTGNLVLSADPSAALGAVTKQYADTVAATSSSWKQLVAAATTTALPACTYNNGTAGVGATLTGNANGALPAQDSVTLTVNQRLLVKDQVALLEEGIYVVTQVGDGSTPFILTRSIDNDQSSEFTNACVAVTSGTVNANKAFRQTATSVTVGTTSIVWIDFLASIYLAGAGLTLTGNSFSVTPNTFLQLSGGTLTGAFTHAAFNLTYASTISVNATLGNIARVTLTGATAVLGNWTGAVDGQLIQFEVTQDGTGGRLLNYDTNYYFGTDLVQPALSTGVGLMDKLLFQYRSSSNKFQFIALARGF